MDVTGQAFEDMQEQNIRLMQQLREKDDANFKLMSERIKSNQIHKLLKEEKEELQTNCSLLKTQSMPQLQVVRKLEEKERLLRAPSAPQRESWHFEHKLWTCHKRQGGHLQTQEEDREGKKPAEKISNGDDILNEEINDYRFVPVMNKTC
ncbi:E3 ubiquitin-protein ligase BRE1B [Nibea albiflora]|uniref:E3 ubiquitin-protein ligase BRE1B n=1 Tax=Nibea albiflora TaxID=240163 RepID=A0ACB7EPV2_NIBAL|nr:E3 ubiquitin-protein ligase BRE1B [Nibea albiflora]